MRDAADRIKARERQKKGDRHLRGKRTHAAQACCSGKGGAHHVALAKLSAVRGQQWLL